MARPYLLFAAAALALPLPVAAGVTVIGSGNARICYVAAESKIGARRADIQSCDAALMEEKLNRRVLVATHVNRGILRQRYGNLAGALADFDAATALNPEEPEAYLNRASTLLRQNDVSRAITEFDAALAKKTRRPALAYYGRALAHEEAGNLRAAYRDYRQASQLAPSWDEPRRELNRFRVVSN